MIIKLGCRELVLTIVLFFLFTFNLPSFATTKFSPPIKKFLLLCITTSFIKLKQLAIVYTTNTVALTNFRDHEKDCEYAPVRCPNSSKCPVILKKVRTTLLFCLSPRIDVFFNC